MKNKLLFIGKILLIAISLFFSIYLVKVLKDLDVLPNKYYILILVGLIIVNIINVFSLLSKKLVLNIIGIILSIIIIAGSCFGIKHGTKIANFMNKAFSNNNIELAEYSVVVLKDSSYNNLNDLSGKVMGYAILDQNKNEYDAIMKLKVSTELKSYDNPYSLYEDLKDKSLDSIVVNEGFMQILEEEYEDFDEKTRIIYTFGVESKIESEVVEEVTELKPVNILISGSDSRSGKIQSKTRSDVNMIMTIDPTNHKILLTSIPRDYYVQLHGKTGLKDKLTHAGIYGINMTKTTLEDLFNIKIDYTIKVGFQSVIQIVDLLGGIDINSDKAFTSHCRDGGAERTKVVKGWNHFTGAQALSYARERYAYREGDNHRVYNQQQVLEAIIDKLSSDRSILRRYDKLLDSLSELYRTDIPSSYIKLIAKDRLENMTSWTIEKQQVSGYGSMGHCCSMPSYNLWIMIPDNNSVKTARNKILKMFGEA